MISLYSLQFILIKLQYALNLGAFLQSPAQWQTSLSGFSEPSSLHENL